MARKRRDNINTFYNEWIDTYKEGFVRDVTLQKYYSTAERLEEIAPDLILQQMTRRDYQNILNEYAKTHERQTTMDFHHQVKGCFQDAFHDRLIEIDPTYKAVVKGMKAKPKKDKFLSQIQLTRLLALLDIEPTMTRDLLFLLIAKTGLRFAEALGLTPEDFNFNDDTLEVNKTWNYKDWDGDFQKTKNEASNRTVLMDFKLSKQMRIAIEGLPSGEPIFIKDRARVFNSTYNNRLEVLCKEAKIPVITLHSLRHTHASILLNNGVTIQTIARRLGHSSTVTTQETYIHIIQELEDKDNDKMVNSLLMMG